MRDVRHREAPPGAPAGTTGRDRARATALHEALYLRGPFPVVLYDPASLAVLETNEAAQRLYGYTAAEFARMTLRDLRLPDEVPAALGRMPRDAGGRVAGGPFRHRDRQGTVLHVDIHVHDVAVEGRQARLAILQDVTARRRAEERERFLSEVSRVLARSLDLQTTLGSIAHLATAHLADGCAVHLRQPAPDAAGGTDADTLALLTVACRDPARAELLRELDRRMPATAAAEVGPGRALRTGRAQLYRELPDGPDAGGPAMRALWRRLGIHSAICVPLPAPAGALGVISLASLTAGQYFDQADLVMAEELAHHAALAVENARLYSAERDARERAERLAERAARLQVLTAALAGTLTAEEVASVVLTQGMAALGAKAGSVSLLDEEGTTLELVGAVGYPADAVERWRRAPLDAEYPPAEAARTGQMIWLPTAEARDARYPQLAALRRANGGGGMTAVPLVVEGRVGGVLGLNFRDDVALGDEELRFVETLASQCAQALERARLLAAERRARAAIEAARLEAESANRTKTEFLAVMSHELRTPLNAIAGYVELLELGVRGPVTAEQRDDLQRIRRNQRHLLGLINDVLNFAKLETGNVRYDVVDVPLREVVEAVEPLIAPQLRQRALHFAMLELDASLVARADRDRLQQILLNLLSNAVKFTEPGGAVRVAGEAAGHEVRLHVHDTGCGIPPERQDSIFDPFVQLDQRLTRTGEGTGLGLAISRDLARAMGGDLTVRSEVGVGSTFTVTLPRRQ